MCAFVQFVQIVYRKDCMMCMKIRRRMRLRAVKSAVLASILSDFLLFFGINMHRIKYKQNVDSIVLCNYVVTIGNF